MTRFRFVFAALVLLAALTLSGCATLSEEECLTADWESIGYRDGSEGYDASRIGRHSEACAEAGETPDRELYELGRSRGLTLYCTGRNGLRLGRDGNRYSGVCPDELEGDFLQGYELGRQMHELTSHMLRLQEDIERIQSELRRNNAPLTESERDHLLYRLRGYEREYGRLQMMMSDLETRGRDL